ncbi:hypothetical protein REPUB_Repub15cG0091500 [Reevesia pubescens]
MVRKRVPDWLNSSLWSTTPNDDRLNRYSPSTPTTTTTVVSEATVQPPVPVPPPATATRPQSTPTPPKSEIRDPVNKNSNNNSNDNDQNGGSSGVSPDDISRQAQLLAELSKKVINMRELRRIASQGIPDGAGIRSTVWKLLLGYLPPDRGQWSSKLAKKRSQYRHFKEELLMNPSEITRRLEKSMGCDNDEPKSESRGLLSRSQITHGEHPLSLGKSSIWNQFFQDSEIIEQIDRDVKRTHPDMHFFSGDLQLAKSNQAAAEADTFFCFVELLSGFRDHFCQQLDNSIVGIRSTITRLSQLLKEHDEELWRHLEVTTKVNPQFYAFRWITLLLTQEFNFADSLHIWDTLLSDPEGPMV